MYNYTDHWILHHTVEHGYGKQAYPKITLTAKLSFIPLILKLHFKPTGYIKLL